MCNKQDSDVTYLNVNFSGVDSATNAKVIAAEETVSKSGTVIDDATDYYVAVVRLKFTTNNPIAIAPCTSAQFAIDGVTTDWSLTVRHKTAGPPPQVEQFGRAFIKLIRPTPVLGQTVQPRDDYAYIFSPEEWVRMLNTAASEAYAACRVLVPGLGATDIPFFSLIGGTGRLGLNVYPFSLWEQGLRPVPSIVPPVNGIDGLDLLSNVAAQPMLGGFGFKPETFPNQPLAANGADYRFLTFSDGSNYSEAAALPFPPSLTPGTPTTAAMIIQQSFACQKMPGITKVAVITSLPTVQEFVPSESGKGSRAVLTDFTPDPTNIMTGEAQTTEIYNASIGDARWIKLKGGGPISTFSVRVITEDWLGQIRTLELTGQGESFDMKLCFAPERIVDNFRSK
tara:strand:- start:2021 stop:3208 length:1188 start_codon:yes stop_codon:yes gene_type:complete